MLEGAGAVKRQQRTASRRPLAALPPASLALHLWDAALGAQGRVLAPSADDLDNPQLVLQGVVPPVVPTRR